ncbi:MAG: DUF2071 domain-containing protein [Saprospiraceae bacterium]|nr:DUF2071 domain-containing protein [Saprospiraceae bacterium]
MDTFLKAKWQNLIMANYEIEASVLLPYLPKGVELDYFEGKTYVSLVGFLFKDTSVFNIPIPFMGTFEEVNLRFYVVRKVDNEVRRGVVFINETVPSKIVAWVANKLYKEHYIAIPTTHKWAFTNDKKEIAYHWKVQSKWNSIKVDASTVKMKMEEESVEEFIFEHYFGYTKVNPAQSIEYKVNHPRWEINSILHSEIECDFTALYGHDFEILNTIKPHSVMLAEGSEISVDWKRVSF